MKHLIAILALCLAAGRIRLQEANALSPILPAGWQPETIPYRLTEADVVRLLGKPDKMKRIDGRTTALVYNLLPERGISGGQSPALLDVAELVIMFDGGTIRGGAICKES